MKSKSKSTKIRKRTVAHYSVADIKPVDPAYLEYAETCKLLKKSYPAKSWDLYMVLENARIVYLRSTTIGKEFRVSRIGREIALVTVRPFHKPSNWQE